MDRVLTIWLIIVGIIPVVMIVVPERDRHVHVATLLRRRFTEAWRSA